MSQRILKLVNLIFMMVFVNIVMCGGTSFAEQRLTGFAGNVSKPPAWSLSNIISLLSYSFTKTLM